MGSWRGLIDANVLVAAAVAAHQHHKSSASLISGVPARSYATPRHCLAEFYSISTRGSVPGGEPLPPSGAVEAIEAYVSHIDTLDISPSDQFRAIRHFAERGGIGARVYDCLIGQVAIVNEIPLIVTWNVRHFEPLFPTLRVATPAAILEESE